MPAARTSDPTSNRSRIRLWLLDHPGHYRPRDIAAALTKPEGRSKSQWTIDVGRECARMAAAEQLTKTQGAYGAEYALRSQPTT